MIVLGLDPAIRTSGYGVLRADSVSSVKVLDCGVITNAKTLPHTECLRRLYGGVSELVGAFSPDCAVLEEPFVGRNSKTAIILGMARGAILAALAAANIPAYSYNPSVGKRAVMGTGGATKERVAMMLAVELGLAVENIPLDSTDALALGIAHIQRVFRPELGMTGKKL